MAASENLFSLAVGCPPVQMHYFYWPFVTGGTDGRKRKPNLAASKNHFPSSAMYVN